MFNNIQYRIKAQIEHVDSSSIFSGHYIAYIQEFGKTFKFNDAVVTETSHTIFRNKNIIFAVFKRYREEEPIINFNIFQLNSNSSQIEQKIENSAVFSHNNMEETMRKTKKGAKSQSVSKIKRNRRRRRSLATRERRDRKRKKQYRNQKKAGKRRAIPKHTRER